MKRGKKLLILAGALAVTVGLLVAVLLLLQDKPAGTENTAQVIFQLDPAKVTKLQWTHRREQMSFSRGETGWVNDADSMFPTNNAPLDKMAEALKTVTSTKTIENPAGLEEYGLNDPEHIITVTADGATYTLNIGNQNPNTGDRYFSKGDGKIYLVSNELAGFFSYTQEGVLLMEQLPDLSSISGLIVEKGDKKVELKKEEDSKNAYSSHYKWFIGDRYLDTEDTEKIIASIRAMQWKGCADYNATEEERKTYKLTTKLTVKCGDSDFVLYIGEDKQDKGYYAQAEGSKMVNFVGYEIYNATMDITAVNALRPNEVLVMDWETVDKVEIALSGNTYNLTCTELPDPNGCATGTYMWELDDTTNDRGKLVGILDSMETTGYADIIPGEENLRLSLVFQRNVAEGEPYRTITLNFYENGSDTCIVTFDGVPTVLAKKSNVDNMIKAIEELVKPK